MFGNAARTKLMAQFKNLSYSMRRYFVDEFYFRHAPLLPAGGLLLDLGGNKIQKRGLFNIENYSLHVTYLNFSVSKCPDIQADAAHLPFGEDSLDAVICAEVLEHVAEPPKILREIYRVLKADGMMLISVPFLFPIHGDPYDYGRYTDYYWMQNLSAIGFDEIQIEKQGLFGSVLVEMLRSFVQQKSLGEKRISRAVWYRIGRRLIRWAQYRALEWDSQPANRQNPYFNSFTTGFGIVARKPKK